MLLVEDNDLNAEIAATILEGDGAYVSIAGDGAQAVEAFAANPAGTFDAILMDVAMPKMDGLAATRAIRALDRPDAASIPIIAMTGNAFQEDVRECLEAGMNAHIAKPIDAAKAERVIAKAMGGSANERSAVAPSSRVNLPRTQKAREPARFPERSRAFPYMRLADVSTSLRLSGESRTPSTRFIDKTRRLFRQPSSAGNLPGAFPM